MYSEWLNIGSDGTQSYYLGSKANIGRLSSINQNNYENHKFVILWNFLYGQFHL